MDWSALVPLVAQAAPTIGSLLGGFIPFPGGAILGKMAGTVLAEALGVPPKPEDIHNAITTGDPAVIQAKLSEAETKINAEVEMFKAQLADVQDARATNVEYVKAGSAIQWAPVVVSVIILLGFSAFSLLAMKPELAGVRSEVVLFLLGAWSGFAGAVVQYWLGSSSGSADKSNQLAALAGAQTPPKPVLKPPGKK